MGRERRTDQEAVGSSRSACQKPSQSYHAVVALLVLDITETFSLSNLMTSSTSAI
jgi:hypothetical protein